MNPVPLPPDPAPLTTTWGFCTQVAVLRSPSLVWRRGPVVRAQRAPGEWEPELWSSANARVHRLTAPLCCLSGLRVFPPSATQERSLSDHGPRLGEWPAQPGLGAQALDWVGCLGPKPGSFFTQPENLGRSMSPSRPPSRHGSGMLVLGDVPPRVAITAER